MYTVQCRVEHVVPHVSCHRSGHEPALHASVLQIVNELATDNFGGVPHGRSRDHERCILPAQRSEFSSAAFSHQPWVKQFVGLLAAHVSLWYQLIHTRSLVGSAQHRQSVQLLCHLWRHVIVIVRGLAKVVREVRLWPAWCRIVDVIPGFQHAILEVHDCLGPFRTRQAQFLCVHVVTACVWQRADNDRRRHGTGTCVGLLNSCCLVAQLAPWVPPTPPWH